MPIFDETLVVKVQNVFNATFFSKPEDAVYSDLYSVSQDKDGTTVVTVKWEEGVPRQPRCLHFAAYDKITAIGFSECCGRIEQYTLRGPCGGNFFLLEDLSGNEAFVENWGHSRKGGYHFALWIGQKRIEIDPRIYNQGELPPQDGGQRKGGFLRFLRRLWRLLTGWLR